MAKKLKEVVIDPTKWIGGLLVDDHGNMCAMGFACNQNYPEADLTLATDPEEEGIKDFELPVPADLRREYTRWFTDSSVPDTLTTPETIGGVIANCNDTIRTEGGQYDPNIKKSNIQKAIAIMRKAFRVAGYRMKITPECPYRKA